MLCGIAGSFTLLIASRIAMGASAAVTRVLVVAMVRDLFDGEAMARIMSLVFMVFMLVPVLAPSVGQLILLFAPWRWIFLVLAAYGLAMLSWSWFRLPETLHPEFRRSLRWREIADGISGTLSDRQSLGYTLALTAIFGGLTAYIASIQQIVFDAFHAPKAIALVFAVIAAPMALSSWLNSRIVEHFGLRHVGHLGLIAFAAVTVGHAVLAALIARTLVAVRSSAERSHGQLRLQLLQSVDAGDGAYGADRRHRILGPGRHRHHRRRRHRAYHRPIVRRHPAAVPDRHRLMRHGGPGADADYGKRPAVA